MSNNVKLHHDVIAKLTKWHYNHTNTTNFLIWLDCHIKFPKICDLVWINAEVMWKTLCCCVISQKKNLYQPWVLPRKYSYSKSYTYQKPKTTLKTTVTYTLFGEVFTSIKNRFDSIIQTRRLNHKILDFKLKTWGLRSWGLPDLHSATQYYS